MATSKLQSFRAALAVMAVVGTLAACGSTDAADTSTTPAASSQVQSSAVEPDAATSAAGDDTDGSSAPAATAPAGSAEAGSTEAGSTEAAPSEEAAASDSEYTDGTYTASGGYVSPGGDETVDVELTIADDVVTAVTVTPHPSNPNTAQFQGLFAGGIADVVVGVSLDELNVSKVSGSSLTSGGFNAAVETIKSEARA